MHLDLEPTDLRVIERMLERPATLPELLLLSRSWSLSFFLLRSRYLSDGIPMEGKGIVLQGRHRLLQLDKDLYCSATVMANHSLLQFHYQHGAALLAADTHRQTRVKGWQPALNITALRGGATTRASAQRAILESVRGIGETLNGLGIPTLSTAVQFEETFNQTPVVNHTSIGFSDRKIQRGKVLEPTDVQVFLLSNIDLASYAFPNQAHAVLHFLPDPLMEKNLHDAIDELNGLAELIDMYSVGLNGLSSVLLHLLFDYESGLDLRLEGYTDFALVELLSMASLTGVLILLPATLGHELTAIAQKWDIPCQALGHLSQERRIRIHGQTGTLVDLSLQQLADKRSSRLLFEQHRRPGLIDKASKFNYKKTPHHKDYLKVTQRMLKEGSVRANQWLWQQLDQSSGRHQQGSALLQDVAVFRYPGSRQQVLLTTGGKAAYLKADPLNGALIAVTESIRKIIIAGGQPAALLLSLNLGSATDPVVNWQLQHIIKGVNEGCQRFNLPVLEATIGMGNEQITKNGALPITPTPVVTVLGTLPDDQDLLDGAFKADGHLIYMIGTPQNDLNGSLYVKVAHGNPATMAPLLDLDEEYHIQQHFSKIVRKGLISSAQNIGSGGLMMALLQAAIPHECGFEVETDGNFRKDTYLFGEHQSRILISVPPEREDELINYLNTHNVPFTMLGEVGGDRVWLDKEDFGRIADWKKDFCTKP